MLRKWLCRARWLDHMLENMFRGRYSATSPSHTHEVWYTLQQEQSCKDAEAAAAVPATVSDPSFKT